MFKRFKKIFSSDIGVDLGTSNTRIYLVGQGVAVSEPSIVAINEKTGRVVAVGNDARQMVGRTPAHISALYPLVDGVISHFEAAEEMLLYFFRRAEEAYGKKILRPRVLVSVPSGITNVERRAVGDAVKNAGAGEVFLVESPMAAAIGAKLPVFDPIGSMVVDFGGGTTDVAIVSLGGVVRSKNLRIAGSRLDQDIISYIRDEFKILLGERTVEELKIAIGSVDKRPEPLEAAIRGRDLVTGLPREVAVTDSDVREAVMPSISRLVDSIKEVLETTPPEVVSDVMNRGITLSGGGALTAGLPGLLERETKVEINIADDPLNAVVRGTGIILEQFDLYQDILVNEEESLPPQ